MTDHAVRWKLRLCGALSLLLNQLYSDACQTLRKVFVDFFQRKTTDDCIPVDIQVGAYELKLKLKRLLLVPSAQELNGGAWPCHFVSDCLFMNFILIRFLFAVSDTEYLLVCHCIVHQVTLVYHLGVDRPDHVKRDSQV